MSAFLDLQAQQIIRGPYLQQSTPEGITIMWRTDIPSDTYVWYGNNPLNLSQNTGISNSATDHEFVISGLNPDTKYYYAVGTSAGMISTPDSNHFFTTHPEEGTQNPIHVWAIGDFGKGNAGQLSVKNSYVQYREASNKKTDVWLWLGDNAYNDGKDENYQDNVFGYSGFNDLFSYIPFYPCPGNHDYNEVWSESVFLGIPYTNIPLEDHQGPYYRIVDVPENAEAGGSPSQLEVFYSFDYGNVHFLSLNSEVYDFTETFDGINQMKAWITQDLQQNDKTFTVAYFHQPPYSKGSHDSDDVFELVMKTMREEIIPLLESFDVDLVINGHSHVYERSYMINGHYGNSQDFNPATMIKNNTDGNFLAGNAYLKDTIQTNNEGTVYVVCGNAGSSETSPELNHPAMIFSEGNDTAYGSFMLDIYRNRLDGKYLSVDGTIHDEFTILKKNMSVENIPDYTLCEGDSIQITVQTNNGSDDIEYVWSHTSDTVNSLYISPVASGNYAVTITDVLTGQAETDTFYVQLTSIPVPAIIFSNDSLMVQSGFMYQWYVNGNLIPGANQYYYIPVTNGNYTVELINGNCIKESEGYSYQTNEITELLSSVKIFPNPFTNVINIESGVNVISVTIYSGIGDLIEIRNEYPADNVKIDLNFMPPGIYLLTVETEIGFITEKIIKY